MDRFEERITIIVDLKSEESIKNALDEYIELFESGKVGEDKEIGDIEFVKKEDNEIKPLLLGDCPNKEELIEYYTFVYGDYMDEEEAKQDLIHMKYSNGFSTGDITYFSEALFFSTACKYTNLRDKAVKACEMIVMYSKSKGTEGLWIDNMYIAGIDALYFLAKNDSKYLYLISEYIIPGWDDEHAPNISEKYLRKLFEYHGMRKEFIKAFVVSDNNYARWHIIPEGERLIDYFENNPEYYLYFKELVIDKYINEECLITEYGENRIKQLYKDAVNVYDDDDELPEYWGKEYESICREIDEKRN